MADVSDREFLLALRDADKEAVATALAAAEKAVAAALAAAEKAVAKAEIATEKRFEATNEFREQLSDQAATFISRIEFDAKHGALDDRIATLSAVVDAKLAGIETKVGQTMPRTETAQRLNSLEGTIAALSSRVDSREGKSSGVAASWGYLVGAVGMLSGFVALIVVLR